MRIVKLAFFLSLVLIPTYLFALDCREKLFTEGVVSSNASARESCVFRNYNTGRLGPPFSPGSDLHYFICSDCCNEGESLWSDTSIAPERCYDSCDDPGVGSGADFCPCDATDPIFYIADDGGFICSDGPCSGEYKRSVLQNSEGEDFAACTLGNDFNPDNDAANDQDEQPDDNQDDENPDDNQDGNQDDGPDNNDQDNPNNQTPDTNNDGDNSGTDSGSNSDDEGEEGSVSGGTTCESPPTRSGDISDVDWNILLQTYYQRCPQTTLATDFTPQGFGNTAQDKLDQVKNDYKDLINNIQSEAESLINLSVSGAGSIRPNVVTMRDKDVDFSLYRWQAHINLIGLVIIFCAYVMAGYILLRI